VSGRLVIVTEIISPYRIPLFNCFAQRPGIDLHVIFLAETDPALRKWDVYKDEIEFSYEVLPSWRMRIWGRHLLLNRGVARSLQAARPEVILCGGYNYPASWQAQSWARLHGIPFVLWSESNAKDSRGSHRVVERLKRRFLRSCSGFVVPGRAACEYLALSGIDSARIFTAANAVDNSFFMQAAQRARANSEEHRRALDLPRRYFLFVGRLVREKGIFELLTAYATLDEALRREVGLVFAGDGPCRDELRRQAGLVSAGVVRFVGFAQRDQLAAYYALAEMLILPTHTDTWGLVVNEAMACGLPVIVTDVAGCVPDLLTENWNGKIVPSKQVARLVSAMREMAVSQDLESMGKNSLARIHEYSPQHWADGIANMMRSKGASLG